MKDTTELRQRLEAMGEPYAAGYFEAPDAPPFARYARGVRRFLERTDMPEWNGGPLYPCGPRCPDPCGICVRHDYSYTVTVDWDGLRRKDAEAAEAVRREMADASSVCRVIPAGHGVGGAMYTHSFPNFRRIVREGLDRYAARVDAMGDETLSGGLTDVLAGIRAYHGRALAKLKAAGADGALVGALERVPFGPARTLYEALVAWNFIYYMDGCDNIGRLDADLIDFWRGEDVTEVFRCLFRNVDDNNGWSGALGPDYNALTVQCLRAIRGMRRPSLELRVAEGMPAEVWDAALDSICAGGGSPSLYNESGYQNALAGCFANIPPEDLKRTCGGGCTETMLTGISNVGSLDAGINLALVFERVMREELPACADFEAFYAKVVAAIGGTVGQVLDAVSRGQELRSRILPQPMRTLLIDDCIDRERDFNNGGARYRWSVVNLAGMINVIDSLSAIRTLVFERRRMDGAELLRRLDAGETFLNERDIPRHGTDDPRANALAARLSGDVCAFFEGKTPWAGERFLPSSIQFTTYVDAGKGVGPTPDGRKAGEPLCDSIGAIHANDRRGVTALLNSAAALTQSGMPGTPVLNVKLEAGRAHRALRALTEAYFRKGGMQMQVTCVSREDLLEAQKHPEAYPDLIVRIGGYSEYFQRLTPELRQTVIDRTFAEA